VIVASLLWMKPQKFRSIGSWQKKFLVARVLDQKFFVPLRDLYQVLERKRDRAEVKQWIEQQVANIFFEILGITP